MPVQFSVGMAFYDKPQGGFFPESQRTTFTVMSLLIHHSPYVGEVIVVDNNPVAGSPLPQFLAKCGPKVKYVAMPTPKGTAPPRNRVFEEAKFDHVVCLDSHVLLYPRSLKAFSEFYENGPGATYADKDLLHGLLVTERSQMMAHHMNDQWRSQMWGTWGLAYRALDGFMFSCLTKNDRDLTYVSLNTSPGNEQRELTEGEIREHNLPYPLDWPGHEHRLYKAGCAHSNTPFKVPGHGMGLFACRKDAWLPFHPEARGFGGEEMTTGYRYRHAGRSVWSVPGCTWWHHFNRPVDNRTGAEVVPYRLTAWDKARNFVLEFNRLGLGLGVVRENFPAEVIHPDEWEQLVSGAVWPKATGRASEDGVVVDPGTVAPVPDDLKREVAATTEEKPVLFQAGCGDTAKAYNKVVTLDALYEDTKKSPSPVRDDMPILHELAKHCGADGGPGRVVELGTHGGHVATAILAARPKWFVSYAVDPKTPGRVSVLGHLKPAETESLEFLKGDSLQVEIPECDLLWVNTDPHQWEHVAKELIRHHTKVRHYIAVGGTTVYGERYNNEPGVLPGVRGFLSKHTEWTSIALHRTDSGVIVLSRDDKDKQQPPGALKKALNFTKAVTRHVADANRLVPDDVFEDRLSACLLCEFRFHDVCGKCGCPVVKKTSWASEQCPLSPPRFVALPLVP